MGSNVVVTEGEEWRRHRRLTGPSFSEVRLSQELQGSKADGERAAQQRDGLERVAASSGGVVRGSRLDEERERSLRRCGYGSVDFADGFGESPHLLITLWLTRASDDHLSCCVWATISLADRRRFRPSSSWTPTWLHHSSQGFPGWHLRQAALSQCLSLALRTIHCD